MLLLLSLHAPSSCATAAKLLSSNCCRCVIYSCRTRSYGALPFSNLCSSLRICCIMSSSMAAVTLADSLALAAALLLFMFENKSIESDSVRRYAADTGRGACDDWGGASERTRLWVERGEP